MGLRLTTKVQVSGWRFLLRRVEHAIVRRDTRMFDDPLQFYSRSMMIGVVVSVLIVVGALAMAYFKPQGKLDDSDLYADKSTYQLYLNLAGRLHPVYNLTSARLVTGSPIDPTVVNSAELDEQPKGQWIGIPGAPYSTPVTVESSSVWSVCDNVTDPDRQAPSVRTSVIVMPLVTDDTVDPLVANEALLAFYQDREFLITSAGRHAIDRTNRALTSAVGIPADANSIPISEAMYNAMPDAGQWQLPPIPAAGQPNTLGLPGELVIGTVFAVTTSSGDQYFLVLPDGIAPVNDTTAAALRATESFGLVAPPAVVSSLAISLPEVPYYSPLPDEPLRVVSRQDEPILCWTWERRNGETAASTRVITGPRLPLPPAVQGTGISQIQGSLTVYLAGGDYVQLESPDPNYGEALYYVDRQGVRYGVPDAESAGALGLTSPKPVPWSIFRLLVEGPVLSRASALLEHDTLPTDPAPRKVSGAAG